MAITARDLKPTLIISILFFFMVIPMGGHRVMRESSQQYNYYDNYYYNPRLPQICENFPAICNNNHGSSGKDCCRSQCVDLKSDMFNCGKCGNWCNYSQVCCGGRCLGVLFDNSNCGRCGNKCSNGGRCNYGMCSYA